MAGPPLQLRVDLNRGFQALGAFEKFGEKRARDVFQRVSLQAAEVLKMTLAKNYKGGVAGLAPLHPFTIANKGANQPLHETGRLADAVEMIVLRRGSRIDYMVGFTDRDDAVQAGVLEFGATITVTARMRNYLAANGLPLLNSTRFLRIPARPIWDKSLEASKEPMRKILQREFDLELSRNRLQVAGIGTMWARMRNRLNKLFR